jgi:hypothetical protein
MIFSLLLCQLMNNLEFEYIYKRTNVCIIPRDTWAFQVACATPLSIQKCPSTMLLKASMYLLSYGVTCVSVGGLICCQWTFFPSFSLFSPGNYSLTLLVVDISTLVHILLISNFYSWHFCRNFICFQFHPSILIYQILYF